MATRADRIQVIFEVDGDGKLKATLGDIGSAGSKAADGIDKAGAATARLQSAAKAAGAVMGFALVAGLGLVIRNTMKSEQELAQLDAILRSTGNAAGFTRDQLVQMAEKFQDKSTFGAGEIIEAQTRLLSYSGVLGQNIPRAMQAIIDQSARLGISLTQSAETIGRALESPSKAAAALAQQGFGAAFTKEVRAQIDALVAAGREGEAQIRILEILEESYGGAAQAARNTFGGALAGLRNTLNDLTTGRNGSLEGATDAVNALTRSLNDPAMQAGFARVTAGLIQITNYAFQAVAGIGALLEQFGSVQNRSRTMLQNQRTDLETQLFGEQRAQRRSWLGAAAVDNAPRVKELQAKIAEIDRELARRPAPPPGWKEGRVVSKPGEGRWANVNSPAPIPGAGGGRTGGAARSAGAARSRAMPDFREEDRRELERMIEATARADDAFERMAATLAGPLATAEYEHKQNLREIEELGRQAGRTSEDVIALKERETERYQTERREIEAMLQPMQQLLDGYREELALIGAGNAERAMMIELRRKNIDLMSKDGQTWLEQARAIDAAAAATGRQIEFMDAFRSNAASALTDFVTGAKSAEDALKSFADSMAAIITRMIAERWMASLFGEQGTKGGGTSGGGWLASLFGALFGGGRAQGGPVSGGKIYEVNERGPEVYERNGRRWLLPGANGNVIPMRQGGRGAGGGSMTINQVINVPRNTEYRSAAQVGQHALMGAQRAVARNR